MKKYLNTLFVTTQEAYLNKEGETIVVSVNQEKKLQLPIHTISGIVCFGNVLISPFLMGFCAENNVAISFLTEYGRFLATVHGRIYGNVLLRREQYRRADDDEFCVCMTRAILMGKIANSRKVLKRLLRDHSEKIDNQKVEEVAKRLEFVFRQIETNSNLDVLRGIEGDAARLYFSVFNELILANKKYFSFDERNRRPPRDPINCLLSFIYTLLMHDIRSALETVGLDSYVGFLHKDRPGRAGLALDMMEEFRSVIADRLVLSLVNRKQIDEKGFRKSETGAVLLTDEARKIILTSYQERKKEEITHPFLEEKISLGLIFYVQALLLARFLRGDLDGYPVFYWR